ncbi:MAG: M23 family metallopeptidase [Casimicrobiaceae bacterium]
MTWPDAGFAARLWFEPAPTALPVPVAGLEARQARDSWGAPRSGGRRHEGIDLFAPRGRAVIATTHGIVWRTGRDPLGGNVVFVLGPGRQLHYYAHLDRAATLARGARVEQRSVLGYVGDSGNAKGGPPHLHYGIYAMGGGALNPYPLLQAPATPVPARDEAEASSSALPSRDDSLRRRG